MSPKPILRLLAVAMLLAAAVLALAACGGSKGKGASNTPGGSTTGEPSAAGAPTQPADTTPIDQTYDPPVGLRGWVSPIEGACLPQNDDLMPGAPRPYRNGVHEGVDFYDSDNCVAMGRDTPIRAVQAGTVIRSDLDFQDLTAQELADLQKQIDDGSHDPRIEDRFRGRQVWIDQGDGVIVRYAHLDRISNFISIDGTVTQGQVIGYMGDSGAPESVTAPGTQVHLHLEVRVWGAYLGQGRPSQEIRVMYGRLFQP